jgi:hypothetical protein
VNDGETQCLIFNTLYRAGEYIKQISASFSDPVKLSMSFSWYTFFYSFSPCS